MSLCDGSKLSTMISPDSRACNFCILAERSGTDNLIGGSSAVRDTFAFMSATLNVYASNKSLRNLDEDG